MTGGGGGGGNGGGGNGNGGTECQTVYRGARLNAPRKSVLSKLAEGDKLELDVRPEGTSYSLYALSSGKEAGVVTHKAIAQIIRCIQEGHTYVAEITTLDGGNCTLDLRMESPK